jgi:gas vesicle protein
MTEGSQMAEEEFKKDKVLLERLEQLLGETISGVDQVISGENTENVQSVREELGKNLSELKDAFRNLNIPSKSKRN